LANTQIVLTLATMVIQMRAHKYVLNRNDYIMHTHNNEHKHNDTAELRS